LALSIASTALGDARYTAETQAPTILGRLVYAQATIESLSESDARRLAFYADRSMRALQAVVETSEANDFAAQSQANDRFRESITRLGDAGIRSGLSTDTVAEFYTQIVLENFGQDFMRKLGTVGGGLDFATMFRNVSAPQNTYGGEDTYLDALNAESATLTETAETHAENAGGNTGPVALQNASAYEISIIDRVRVNGDKWEISVQTGDSLSAIASAIYGDSLSYTIIYNANRNVLTNPNVLEVGTIVQIPKPHHDGNS
jgi:hypothetical protein